MTSRLSYALPASLAGIGMSTGQKAADDVSAGGLGKLAQVIATRGGKAAPEP